MRQYHQIIVFSSYTPYILFYLRCLFKMVAKYHQMQSGLVCRITFTSLGFHEFYGNHMIAIAKPCHVLRYACQPPDGSWSSLGITSRVQKSVPLKKGEITA